MTDIPILEKLPPIPSGIVYDPQRIAGDLGAIASLPRRLEILLKECPPSAFLSTYREGGWNVAEIVHHLVDSHLHSYLRCKFALCETRPVIHPYEENDWVKTPECAVVEVPEALSLLAALHLRWVRLLERLDEIGWRRTFHHPERKVDYALFEQVAIYAWHGDRHLSQAAIALQRPVPS